MSLEINSAKASSLASELAAATGEDVDTAVVRAIEERLVRVTRQSPLAEDGEIDTLFEKLAKMPVLDARSPDEILGYGRMDCRTDGNRHIRYLCCNRK